LFICFDGIDGAGKSTQVTMLRERLQQDGHDVVQVADPGTTQIGTTIRQLLLNTDQPITPAAQMLLFAAARVELTAYIRQLLDSGKTVICDRWLLSTLVYQAAINNVDKDLILTVFAGTSNLQPDVCIVLDVDPVVAVDRKLKNGKGRVLKQDRYEAVDMAVKQKMRAAYLEYAGQCPFMKSVIVLDGMHDKDIVHEKIYTHVVGLLPC
jgi:dTMP kinase